MLTVDFSSFFRQLEAIIRIAESQAKMRLSPFATEADIDEALRLFQVSTLDAATSGNLAGKFCQSLKVVGVLFLPNCFFLFSNIKVISLRLSRRSVVMCRLES